ncbi:glycosyltransferase family 4 protein [Desulfuribacillus alkaliarsenatis]|uniref:Glycosyl transferase family 1 domain-containing protein n=1 Tax=Desulfuribacillus alkaliarsenatis TaxID=766136 RepID=A0A1E5G0Q2_9FIRM|nr:glycosyltransferase family 4 protein [Desulfuribacillus alkaliarsenatis]OEF96483.1 hypothetical protein BHF68_07450 [Desulfuribacillus alkaliarsenatis]
MKIVIASPYLNSMRGNTMTAKRIINTLEDTGVDVTGINYNDQDSISDNIKHIVKSDCIHILNPIRYLQSEMYKKQMHVTNKYGITFTGTDLNVYLATYHNQVLELLSGAAFITVFHEQAYNCLIAKFPSISSKTHIVGQGYYELGSDIQKSGNADEILEFIKLSQQQGKCVLVLPAGVRKIKRIQWAIELVANYNKLNNNKLNSTQLVLCVIGPVIEAEEYERVTILTRENPHIRYFKSIHQKELIEIIRISDILINSSESEGQSIAIIEAFYQRTPVIASRCPGNEQMIEHGKNGYLFNAEEEFNTAVDAFINKPDQTLIIVDTAHELAKANYSTENEIAQYIQLYRG